MVSSPLENGRNQPDVSRTPPFALIFKVTQDREFG